MKEYMILFVTFKSNPHNGDYARIVVHANSADEAKRRAKEFLGNQIVIQKVTEQ